VDKRKSYIRTNRCTKAVAKVKITAKPDGKETTYDSEMPMSKEDDIWKLRLTSRGYVIQ
jgi:hypothetical protein